MADEKITKLSLKEFRLNVSDIARPNRFEVKLTPPEAFSNGVDQLQLLSWLTDTAQIPSRTQGEVKIKYHGMGLTLPGDYEKENLTIGFLNEYGWKAKKFFDMWMETLQNIYKTNKRVNSFDALYASNVVVSQLGRTDSDILYSYKFYNIYPTNISTIDLNMGEYDSVEKFTVSFAYSHFVSVESESNG